MSVLCQVMLDILTIPSAAAYVVHLSPISDVVREH